MANGKNQKNGNGKTVRLSLRGVSKVFFPPKTGQVEALANINIDVKAGEFLTLVGPSGCGKSTILNIIAGFVPPDSGQVFIDDRPITGPGPDRVVLFQEQALFQWLTVEQNVGFGLEMTGVPITEREERIQKYLSLVHMLDFRNSQIHELSGGMKQRVALARALAMEPEVLLMDEPFSALDSHTRERLQSEIQEIWEKTHKTIVFVTHGLKEAVALGDRVILLTTRPGRIQREISVRMPRPRYVDDKPVLSIARELKSEISNWVDPITRQSETV
jgi:NitT/TauT family transport system ATP-binding protein